MATEIQDAIMALPPEQQASLVAFNGTAKSQRTLRPAEREWHYWKVFKRK